MDLKVGIVVHGPGIVDSGYVERILDILKEFSEIYNVNMEVTAKVGGNMGRVAVIDRGLEDVVDISEKLYPSQCLRRLGDRDVLLLLNYGKSKKTGHTFGRIVVERAKVDKPVIQIERPGEDDGSILVWNRESCRGGIEDVLDVLVYYISKMLGLEVEECIGSRLSVWEEGDRVFRRIGTVDPGEVILIDGVVVGKVLRSPVILVSEGGKIVEIVNGEIKRDGIERLGSIDLRDAVVKTGVLRRGSFKGVNRGGLTSISRGEILIVDRGDVDILGKLEGRSVSTVVTVGSDTTLILSGILGRFNVKIIGVVDGDIHSYRLVDTIEITEGSRIFLLKNCECHQVGKLLIKYLKNRRLSYQDTLRYIEDIMERHDVDYEVLLL